MIPIPAMGYVVALVAATSFAGGWKVCDWRHDSAELEAQRIAVDMLDQTHKDARAKEREHAKGMSRVSGRLAQERRNGTAERDRLLADLELERVRRAALDDRGDDRGEPGAVGTPARGGDGAAACDIPKQTARDLVALAADADDVARALAGAQSVILADREVCR